LEILHELKHNFEMLYGERSHKKPVSAGKGSVNLKSHKKESPHTAQKKLVPAKKIGKKVDTKSTIKGKGQGSKKATKATTKVAKAKNKNKVAGKSKKAKPLKKKLKNGDDLLLEIEASKRKLRVENPKQQEQINLIDQFIKSQPSISNAREKGVTHVPTGDLAAFKQGEFGDQIISETLVSILVSQGKKEKAVEVLRKLIWKFPQKKAYFAAQIEELKK
jgi:predicted Zn-dependent protease